MTKANALYRDGSKLSQPLNSVSDSWEAALLASVTAEGEKAPMLSEKGVGLDQEVHGALGAPVLTGDAEVDHSRAAANKLILVAGTLAAIFMLIAWFRGDPDSKTLT